MLSIICSALAYPITYYILARRAFSYIRILVRFCQVVNDWFLSDCFPRKNDCFFTPEKERMDFCLRRNDGICRNDGIYRNDLVWLDSCLCRNDGGATYKWIPAFAGMTGRLRRNGGICRNDGIYRINWFDWIPACAGMTRIVSFTPEKERMDSCLRRNDGICRNDGIYRMSWFDWIPAFAGMTALYSSLAYVIEYSILGHRAFSSIRMSDAIK